MDDIRMRCTSSDNRFRLQLESTWPGLAVSWARTWTVRQDGLDFSIGHFIEVFKQSEQGSLSGAPPGGLRETPSAKALGRSWSVYQQTIQ